MSASNSPFATGAANMPKAVSRARGSNHPPAVDEPISPLEFASDMDTEAATRAKIIRETRVGFGDHETRLGYEQRPGFMRRWFNDTSNGHVEKAKKRGWELVMDADGKPVNLPAGTREEGGKLSTYLMEIPLEIYQEDQDRKQEKQDDIDQAIYDGSYQEEKGDNRYVPSNTTKIRVNTQTPRRR